MPPRLLLILGLSLIWARLVGSWVTIYRGKSGVGLKLTLGEGMGYGWRDSEKKRNRDVVERCFAPKVLRK